VAPAARRGAPLRSYNKKTVDIDPEVRQGTTPVVEFDADELSAKLNATFDDAKRNWDRLDEKPAAVALTVSILVGLWVRRAACSALLGAIARSPAREVATVMCCWLLLSTCDNGGCCSFKNGTQLTRASASTRDSASTSCWVCM